MHLGWRLISQALMEPLLIVEGEKGVQPPFERWHRLISVEIDVFHSQYANDKTDSADHRAK
jgi:hypothetical protein